MSNTIVKRTQLEHYMDVSSSETPQWARMGDGWSKFDDATSAQTESTKYINMDTESTDTTSYKTAYNFECDLMYSCLLYTSPSPRDQRGSRMPSSA